MIGVWEFVIGLNFVGWGRGFLILYFYIIGLAIFEVVVFVVGFKVVVEVVVVYFIDCCGNFYIFIVSGFRIIRGLFGLVVE